MARTVFGAVMPHPPILVPAVGGRRADEACDSLAALDLTGRAARRFDPETIVLISPHAPGVADAFVVDDSASLDGSLEQFGDPHVTAMPGDPDLAREILAGLAGNGLPAIARSAYPRLRPGWLDHATLVPLWFLDPGAATRIVVLSLSWRSYADHRLLGEVVFSAAEKLGRRVAFIASGDMSHRLTPGAAAGYSPRAAELDANIVGLVEQGRLAALMDLDPGLVEEGAECGLRSIIALGGFCCDDPAPARLLAYEGPWGVGYLTALVGRAALDAAAAVELEAHSGAKGGMPGHDASEIVALARRAIAARLGADTPPHEVALSDPDLPERAGAFVSLHRGGMLRGCIGTILPVQPTLAAEVAHNAVEAAFSDPRFPPLAAHELEDLDITVDVLHAPETCSIDELDPKSYGVVVSSGWRRGLLLPDLEGVDDVGTQVRIALQKAGIGPHEPCNYERFRVDRYA